ncbi:nitrogenase component 1 [Treponema primitia]|uniref:nitrogenase component 1 n=1 Tax=Treponema primitia TaxID=88058 RepID=UPI0002554F6B|nr:nitrogenase component 1 [Treponema primitia]
MSEIAIYGKGGIGKSTISSNISAVLGRQGKKILQIGCDPKHDSTRFLLHGERITTVLDYLKGKSPDQCNLSDIVHTGAFGVHCVEAGGPEPGVGCAGRGILSTFELLDRLGIKENNYDDIIYDVLGDVVCGGFAVPIRRGYAEKVYIVTSGEFMAIYAANNILRGLGNYDLNKDRAGGIIFNSRGLVEEEDRVKRFCDAVGLPLIARFPRSDLFSDCEREGKCLVEAFLDSDLAEQFAILADKIHSQKEFYAPAPLSDEELEERILGKKAIPVQKQAPVHPVLKTLPQQQAFFSKSLVSREPLHGCAFSGAMSITTQIDDSISIAHGPRSCAHITYQSITSIPRRFLLERGIVLPYGSSPPVVSSEMNEGVMIFGGADELRQKILEAKARSPKVLFILTTCPSGIIGDDLRFVQDLADDATRIVPVLTDGNIQGDYLQGILMAYRETARALIDRNCIPENDTVNIVAEKSETNAREKSFRYVKDILDRFGIRINCHFICETTVDEIRRFRRGKLNLLAYGDYMGRSIRTFLETEFGAEFLDKPFPIGFRESCDWVRSIGEYFHKEKDKTDAIVTDYRKQYQDGIDRIKPYLEGRRLMVITYNQNIDWMLQTALDLGMKISFVGILNFSQDNNFMTDLKEYIQELYVPYDHGRREADIARVKPDLLLANYGSNEQDQSILTDTIPLCPTAGFLSGLLFANRWAEIFKMNLKEGWRQDELLFRKYSS